MPHAKMMDYVRARNSPTRFFRLICSRFETVDPTYSLVCLLCFIPYVCTDDHISV